MIEWEIPLLLLAAVGLAMPTAWNRETQSRIMGLRSFPLVSLGAASYVLIGQSIVGTDSPEALARIVQGLMAGIGFVGGGAILKNDDSVKGTASAASIWVTGALGAAVGFRLWTIAVTLSVFNFLIVFVLSRYKQEP